MAKTRKTGLFSNIFDGIVVWFDGPEWDDVAKEEFETARGQVENYARNHAPWEDRTGDARAGLTTDVYENDGSVFLELAHTVEYGLWLEIIQNGRFAIILPTLEVMAPQVMGKAVARISRARRGRN